MVASLAVGVALAALERTREILAADGVTPSFGGALHGGSALEAELHRMEAELEAARLSMLRAAWMADNGRPNSTEASMAKA
jgi:acyl-CoA dehydrogenase